MAEGTGAPVACDFCGRSAPEIKMTGEHVRRRKYKSMFPELTHTERAQTYLDVETGRLVSEPLTTVPVSPFDQTSRRVCDECNRGWMNDLEVAIEDKLVQLMQDGRPSLPGAWQADLAGWMAKTSVVRGGTDKGAPVFSGAERAHIAETLRPPLGWRIWIARVAESASSGVVHPFMRRAVDTDNPRSLLMMHSSVLVLRRVAIASFGAQIDDAPAEMAAMRAESLLAQRVPGAVPVWPIRAELDWPPPACIDAADLACLGGLAHGVGTLLALE